MCNEHKTEPLNVHIYGIMDHSTRPEISQWLEDSAKQWRQMASLQLVFTQDQLYFLVQTQANTGVYSGKEDAHLKLDLRNDPFPSGTMFRILSFQLSAKSCCSYASLESGYAAAMAARSAPRAAAVLGGIMSVLACSGGGLGVMIVEFFACAKAGDDWGQKAGGYVADAVKMAHGEHQMVCSSCKRQFQTTKQPHQEGYGLCENCRHATPPLPAQAMPQPAAPVAHPRLQIGMAVQVQRRDDSWSAAHIDHVHGDGSIRATLDDGTGVKEICTSQLPTMMKIVATYHRGESVYVLRSDGSWSAGMVTEVATDGSITVTLSHGETKTIPRAMVVSQIKLLFSAPHGLNLYLVVVPTPS